MGTYAIASDVTALRATLTGFVTSITDDDSTTQAYLQAEAQLALDEYCDARLAAISINAAAIESYSNGAGMSIVRKQLEDAKAAAAAAWATFIKACLAGGVQVPSVTTGSGVWDLSGTGI